MFCVIYFLVEVGILPFPWKKETLKRGFCFCDGVSLFCFEFAFVLCVCLLLWLWWLWLLELLCFVRHFTLQVLQLLHNCEDHFHMYSLTAVHSCDLYHTHMTSFSSYNGYKLNSHLTCFQWGFIAQSVERRTGIAEVMGFNLIGASEFFLGFLCNCLSC